MAAAFEPVDRNGIAADRLRLQRMTDGCAFVDHLDASIMERWQHLHGIVARRFNDLHAAFDDRLDHPRIIRRIDDGQEGQVHAERLVGHVPALRDFVRKIRRRLLGQAGDDAKPARIRNGGSHLRKTDIMHPPLNDGVLNAEHVRDAGLHGANPLKCKVWPDGGRSLRLRQA